ncbi:DNA-binding protein [Paenibacillus sp. MZ04-78.2]|uniref:DNA-binding protein n=1 Tax=Paenibacillus sp. MZ04-78.2 TaxID=2962034 RepID=UPI0020B87034|nr:DNA-binding protein [Paenibacillus sp. MZ04-78.2]MCP3776119.1 DNA-binding protein [Paenibacillus sp. MZ04-78.2]
MKNVGLEKEMKDHFFYAAEHLFKEEKKAEAAPLYRHIIDRETDCNDQTFLLCHLRLFQCLVGVSSEGNKEALEQFEPFYTRLPEDTRLDALLLTANVCYSLGDWKRVERYGNELYASAQNVYDELKKEKFVKNLHTERHLVVYYGHGLRIKGFVLTMQGRYEEAKKCVAAYSDLGWFECLDETGKKEVEKFRIWGKANMYNLELKTGNNKVLPELSDFLDQNREEILPSLLSVVESANQFRFDADDIINKFSIWLPPVNSEVTYINGTQLFHFWYEKAKYDFNKNRIVGGIDELLYALYLAHRMNYYMGFEKCVSLYREHSDYVTEQQKIGYKNIVEGVFDL